MNNIGNNNPNLVSSQINKNTGIAHSPAPESQGAAHTPNALQELNIPLPPSAESVLQNAGLTVLDLNKTLSKLSPEQLSQLSAVGAALANNPNGLPAVEASFQSFVQTTGDVSYEDVNALVQAVLREAYTQNTEDLRMFAEKVQFFNNTRKALRAEAKRQREFVTAAKEDPAVREALASGADASSIELPHMFEPNTVSGRWSGGTDADVRSATQAINTRTGDAWFETKTSESWTNVSRDPLAIDLNQDGIIETQEMEGDGVFDINSRSGLTRTQGGWNQAGTETERFGQWFGPEEGILVMERGAADGNITADELFGDTSVTGRTDAQGNDIADGLDDLAQLDSNNDGVVNSQDENFKDIKVWVDANSNGVADPGELTSLFQNNISELSTQQTGGAVEGEDAGIIRQSSSGITLEGAIKTLGELEDHGQAIEDQLNSVGEDAQLANLNLQNMLQKQQQTLQMLSNISKSLHDTAMSVIRKIGG